MCRSVPSRSQSRPLLLRVRRARPAPAPAFPGEPSVLPRVRAAFPPGGSEGGSAAGGGALPTGVSARTAAEAAAAAARSGARRAGGRATSARARGGETGGDLRPRRDGGRAADRAGGGRLRLRRADEEGDAVPAPCARPRPLLAAPRQARHPAPVEAGRARVSGGLPNGGRRVSLSRTVHRIFRR